MKDKKRNKKKGFTLIEILVAILIIGILAAIALPRYNRSVEKSRTAEPLNLLSTIAKTQQSHKLATTIYTDKVGELDLSYRDLTGEQVINSDFSGEYFKYTVYGEDKAMAVARRNTGAYELYVYYPTAEIFCRPSDNKTCIDLNLEDGEGILPEEDSQEPTPQEPVNPCAQNPTSNECCEYTGNWIPCTPPNPCSDPNSWECCEYTGDYSNCMQEITCAERWEYDTFERAECEGKLREWCFWHYDDSRCCNITGFCGEQPDPCMYPEIEGTAFACAQSRGELYYYCNDFCEDWQCAANGYFCNENGDLCDYWGHGSYECCSVGNNAYEYYQECSWYREEYLGGI